jgi:hypothetical protein
VPRNRLHSASRFQTKTIFPERKYLPLDVSHLRHGLPDSACQQKNQKKPVLFRGLIYAALIFTVEFWAGRILSKKNLCPWDYSRSKWHIGKVIRLDYLPFWFLSGLLFERILLEQEPGVNPEKQRKGHVRKEVIQPFVTCPGSI